MAGWEGGDIYGVYIYIYMLYRYKLQNKLGAKQGTPVKAATDTKRMIENAKKHLPHAVG